MASLYGSDSNPIIEALIDGVWTDVTSRVRNAQRVTITRGRSSEQSRAAAQRAQLSFENRDGFFSTRLPSSVNYRKIGKNTQIRISAGRGDNHLKTLYNDQLSGTGAITSDKPTLDITGDIDIRAEIWPHSWRRAMPIIGKWRIGGNQRSYMLRTNSTGNLILSWSSAGTSATINQANSTVALPAPGSGRLAVRVTLDVDNGAAGRTATFYTADTVAGPWTVLGAAVVQAGVTSIFAGTASLTLGRGDDSNTVFAGNIPYGGKIYRGQILNGIGGTLVADFDPNAVTVGTTTWNDGLGTPNTWNILGTAIGTRITSDRVRFWGELASLPKEWDLSGEDVTVPARAAGMLQRLSQGVKAFDSAMTRNFRGLARAIAWWPLEDEGAATMAANLAPGSNPKSIIYTGKPVEARLGDSAPPPGAKSCLAFSNQNSRFFGKIDLRELQLTYNYSFYIKLDALPASSKVFYSIDFAFGARIDVALSPSGWDIGFYDFLGNTITTNSTAIGLINPVNGWVGYQLVLTDDGTGVVSYSQRWDTIGTFGGGVGPTVIPGYALNPPTYVRVTAANDSVYSNLRISHIRVDSTTTFDMSNDTYRNASNAYLGETAASRLVRLSAEEGVPLEVTGSFADSEPMGYQGLKSYPDLIAECWEVDGGIGGEARDAFTLEYRTRADLEAREDLVLSHDLSDMSEVPRPTDDDQDFSNDVTVTRTGGSSARSVVVEGFTSISDPPAGVGRYNTEKTLNLASDDRLFSVTGWLALLMSWDQDRYPELAVALHRGRLLADDALFRLVMGARPGDTVTVAGLPSWMPPDRVPQIVQGYTEQLSRFLWDISFNCSPAGPHQATPTLGSDVFPPRLDAVAHTIGGALTTTATSVSFVTPTGSARWVDSAGYAADFPFEVVIGGEVIRVTAISGTASPQTATLVRSVNGVVKAHSSGAAVRLARPFYVGR